ncbi:MAG: DUF429 domain-containing protein [Actinomycetota bacterium]
MNNSFAGIDGCRGGWFAVINTGIRWKAELYAGIADFWRNNNALGLVLIDIPIGVYGKRRCEKLARKLLPPGRKSTIFNPPVKEALGIDDYWQASRTNHAYCGKKLSRQSFNLIPKIREVNDFLAAEKKAAGVIYESHPEICFTRFSKIGLCNKKTSRGRKQRLDIIKNIEPEAFKVYLDSANKYRRRMAAYDDIADAIILAITAGKGKQGLQFVPPGEEKDGLGLRMQIAF